MDHEEHLREQLRAYASQQYDEGLGFSSTKNVVSPVEIVRNAAMRLFNHAREGTVQFIHLASILYAGDMILKHAGNILAAQHTLLEKGAVATGLAIGFTALSKIGYDNYRNIEATSDMAGTELDTVESTFVAVYENGGLAAAAELLSPALDGAIEGVLGGTPDQVNNIPSV